MSFFSLTPNHLNGGEADPLMSRCHPLSPPLISAAALEESSGAHRLHHSHFQHCHGSLLFCLGASSEATGSHSTWKCRGKVLVRDPQPMGAGVGDQYPSCHPLEGYLKCISHGSLEDPQQDWAPVVTLVISFYSSSSHCLYTLIPASWDPIPKDLPHQSPRPGSDFRVISTKAGRLMFQHTSQCILINWWVLCINKLVSFLGWEGWRGSCRSFGPSWDREKHDQESSKLNCSWFASKLFCDIAQITSLIWASVSLDVEWR